MLAPLDLSTITAAPEWLFSLAGESPAANSNAVPLPSPPALDRHQRPPDAREMAYGRRALDRECAKLAGVATGGRNVALNNAALAVATLFASGVVDEGEARARLFAACEVNGLTRGDPQGVHNTITSGFRKGRANPRGIPEPEPAGGAVLVPSPAAVDAAFNGLVWDDEAAEDVAVEWLVKGLIPRQGVGLMPGQSTMGKSFAAMDLAGAVATGLPWFGRKTRMQGGTLLLVGEAAATIRPRMTALREKLRPLALDAETGEVRFRADKLPIVWGEVANLTAPAALAAAEALVRKVSAEMQTRFGFPLRLVIVDTALAAFLFPEDPDASQVQLAINGMKRLAEACDGFAIATHHHGKSVEAGAVGSFMWRGAVDIELSVTGKKLANGDVKDRKITLEKNRHGPTGEVGGFELVKVEVGRDEDGDAIMGAYITPETGEAGTPRPSLAPERCRLSPGGIAFRDALARALEAHGELMTPIQGGPEMRVVDLEKVRTEFYGAWPASGGTEAQRRNTARQRFNTGQNQAVEHYIAGRETVDGVTVVWAIP